MKKYAIILFVVLLYLVISLGIGHIDSSSKKYIYIDTNVRWEYSNKKWNNIDRSNNIELKNYHVYAPYIDQDQGKHDLRYIDGEWYIKETNDYVLYDNILLAYKANNKFKIYEYDREYEISKSEITDILKKIGISGYSALSTSDKIKIDSNDDGDSEYFYIISNMFSESNESSYFSVVAYYSEGDYKIVKSTITKTDNLINKTSFNIFAIIDFDGDNNLEIIISEEKFSLLGNEYSLYGLDDGEYIELVSSY
ncbi:MAG: hypothetical protein IJ565_03650 [Bacilli bacterium]|nr:hypothetical protein [Bacilli bacterium]